jgi:hypothetical protein
MFLSWPRTVCDSGFHPRHREEELLEQIGDAELILQHFRGGAQWIGISFPLCQ